MNIPAAAIFAFLAPAKANLQTGHGSSVLFWTFCSLMSSAASESAK
jgi:hypothetical protein